MVEIQSTDYHDFVIKNGKLIGEFEQMYRKSKDIPWHQNEQEDWLDIKLMLDMLMKYAPFDFICDFGCGLGYFIDILRRHLGSKRCKSIGYDVSPTCNKKAKQLFPDIDFKTFDLTAKRPIGNKINSKRKLFSIRGTLWYVFPKMKNVVKNIACMAGKDDILVIVQNFPPLKNSFVGKSVLPEPDAIVKWFGGYFEPLETIWLQKRYTNDNDNWFIGIFRRNEK